MCPFLLFLGFFHSTSFTVPLINGAMMRILKENALKPLRRKVRKRNGKKLNSFYEFLFQTCDRCQFSSWLCKFRVITMFAANRIVDRTKIKYKMNALDSNDETYFPPRVEKNNVHNNDNSGKRTGGVWKEGNKYGT